MTVSKLQAAGIDPRSLTSRIEKMRRNDRARRRMIAEQKREREINPQPSQTFLKK